MKRILAGIASIAIAFAVSANAETTVNLAGVHLCCGGCVKGVNNAVGKVKGASVACNKDDGTVKLTATDDATAKKALAAIGRAGYYGKSDSAKLGVPIHKVKATTVSKLEISGVHLCCGRCVKAVDTIVTQVKGAEGHDADKGTKTFTVTGKFNSAELIEAFRAEGLNARVAKAKKK